MCVCVCVCVCDGAHRRGAGMGGGRAHQDTAGVRQRLESQNFSDVQRPKAKQWLGSNRAISNSFKVVRWSWR